MSPPAPRSVEQLRLSAAALAEQLADLHRLWLATQDVDVLDEQLRVSARYERTLGQLARALDRQRQDWGIGL